MGSGFMKIQVVDGSTRFSGGRRMLFLHANELVRRGHDVTLWVEQAAPVDWLKVEFSICLLGKRSVKHLPPCDICLFQRWRFAPQVADARHGIPVHFCQGFEGTDAENRLARLKAHPWQNLAERWKLWRRLRRLDHAYRLPTVKIVVHQPLRELIARRYRQWSYLVPYGLAEDIFFVPEEAVDRGRNVLVVGPGSIGWKRIGDALAAVRLLKQRMADVRLIRISPEPMSDAEKQAGVVDEYHTMLPPIQMAEQYRRSAVLLVPSDATEGFGLPALEAMACGTPTVLTDIPSFRSFARPADFAWFVPVGRPEAMARALERVLTDRPLRDRLTVRGLEVAAHYTTERSYQAMSDTLAEVLVRRGARFLPPCKRLPA
jgi:glycosyltransferase involved in cell wall biosynthesis